MLCTNGTIFNANLVIASASHNRKFYLWRNELTWEQKSFWNISVPVKESPTIYDAFIVDKPPKPERNGKDTPQSPKKQSQKKQQKPVEKKDKASSLDDAIPKVTVEQPIACSIHASQNRTSQKF